MVVVVMGVSGAGKTTVGMALAAALGWPFVDGDDVHPSANVEKMRRGEPLDDADREPWLRALAGWISTMRDGVVACSALKASYRRLLRVRDDVRFVWLDLGRGELERRMRERRGHFMPAALLGAQIATMEEPTAEEDVVRVDGGKGVAELVGEVRRALRV